MAGRIEKDPVQLATHEGTFTGLFFAYNLGFKYSSKSKPKGNNRITKTKEDRTEGKNTSYVHEAMCMVLK